MTERLRRVAVVTGGSQGLGEALVGALAQRGWSVLFSAALWASITEWTVASPAR